MERRIHYRSKVAIRVDWSDTPACIHNGRVTSLSARGCFIQTDVGRPKGSAVFIRFMEAPESLKVLTGVIHGRVLYHLERVGLGVEFARLKDGDARDLQDLTDFYRSGEEEEVTAAAHVPQD